MQYAFNYKINQSFETKDTDTFNQLKKNAEWCMCRIEYYPAT